MQGHISLKRKIEFKRFCFISKFFERQSVYLNTAYFVENNKKVISGLLFIAENTVQQCTFALMHCSCPMNSARGAGPIKKKKKGAKRRNANAKT